MKWQEEIAREMARWGFKRGKYNPCLYYNPTTNLICMVHGDDFMSAGSVEAAKEFRTHLKGRFEIKTQILGSESRACRASTTASDEDDQTRTEGRVLNRIIRWTADGWEVELDQRHVDMIVQEMGMLEAKPVSTPGEPEIKRAEEESEELDEQYSSKFMSIAARANYLAADRTELMYSVKA